MTDESIVFFGNRDLGLKVLQHLISVGDAPRAVVLHEPRSSDWVPALSVLARSVGAVVIHADKLTADDSLQALACLSPTIGISAYFGRILPAPVLALFPKGILNFHGSLLPWNRGRDPNVWAIRDRTPAGGTIHLMDAGVDTGPILVQQEVVHTPDVDAAELYRRTVEVLQSLFMTYWPALKEGRFAAHGQTDRGPTHRRYEFERLRQLDLTQTMTLRTAIDTIRACAVDAETGAEFFDGNVR